MPFCKKNEEVIYIKFKRPNDNEFGEQIGIDLKYGNSTYYVLEIFERGKPGNYIDSLGNRFGFTGIKRLDNEGKWEFGVFYEIFCNISFIISAKIYAIF